MTVTIGRRELLVAVGSAAAAWPIGARAQQSVRVRRIGILLYSQQELPVIRPCLQELETLGYVDGKTVAIEYRDAEGKYERLSPLAAELVVDVGRARDISTRPREARHKSACNRIVADNDNDRYRRRRLLDDWRLLAAKRKDHVGI